MISRIFLYTILTFCVLSLEAQIFEPFNVRYQFTPTVDVTDTDFLDFNATERTSQHQWEATFRYPITFGKRNTIILPELSHKLIYQDVSAWPASINEPTTANLSRLFIKGVFPLGEKWNLLGVAAVSQGVSKNNNWEVDNTYYRLGGGFLINNKAGNQIGASVQFIEELNLPAPAFIFIGASKNQRWNYNVTLPLLSIVEYNINTKWRLRFEERLDNDRFVLDADTGKNYNQTLLNFSFGTSYQLINPVLLNVQVGLTPLNVLTYYEDRTYDLGTVNFSSQMTFGFSLYLSVNPRDYTN